MTNGNGKIDWSNLWKNEDWWACWIGWFILILAIYGVAPHAPKLGGWTSGLAKAFPKGFGPTFTATLYLFLFSCAVTFVAGIFMKFDLKNYIPGFLVIFILSFISMVISKQAFMKKWGISYVLFALCFGLIISNVFKVPKFLKAAGQTEFFVKIGLVCMGATIMFSVVLKAGAMGVIQAVLVATTVWFMTYYICRKFGIGERFSSIIATANSICGVSATIAAGGAIQGDPKEISYMIAWVLVCAVVLILVMPPIAVWLNLPTNMAGAWLGGVIDNTGAVIAAGEILRNFRGRTQQGGSECRGHGQDGPERDDRSGGLSHGPVGYHVPGQEGKPGRGKALHHGSLVPFSQVCDRVYGGFTCRFLLCGACHGRKSSQGYCQAVQELPQLVFRHLFCLHRPGDQF